MLRMGNNMDLNRIQQDLNHPSREVKFSALESLRNFDDKKAIDILIDVLNDQSWHLRERASTILGTKGHQAVKPLINALLDGVWYVRAASAKSLGEIGVAKALLPLSKFWEDDNRTVRQNVNEAIANIIEQNEKEAIAGVLIVSKDINTEYILNIISSIDEELFEDINNLLNNPDMIDDIYISQEEQISNLSKEKRSNLLHRLRRRLYKLESA